MADSPCMGPAAGAMRQRCYLHPRLESDSVALCGPMPADRSPVVALSTDLDAPCPQPDIPPPAHHFRLPMQRNLPLSSSFSLHIWRTPWPPAAGTWRSRPKVHTGFLHCYRSGELDVRLARGVRRAVQRAARAGAGPVRVLVTGHSLGGALGMLCAYDVARAHPGLDVSCYTFGTPRVGNRAFADLYGGLVPDTWHVVNGDVRVHGGWGGGRGVRA